MLTQARLKSFKTRNELIAALNRGEFTEKQLRSAYSKLRSNVLKQVKAIEKSEIGFVRGEKPNPRALKNLWGEGSLVSEVMDTLRFVNSKSYSIKSRLETRTKTLQTLAKRGIYIPRQDYLKWVEFIQWFRMSEYAALYDSDSDVTQDIFAEGYDSDDWERLFREYVSKGKVL